MSNETSVARQRGAADAFRPLHFVMAFVSVGYVIMTVLPELWVILFMFSERMGTFFMHLCFDNGKLDVATRVAFWLSIVLNTALFSVRQYVRRDCLLPMLYGFFVLLCAILVEPSVRCFYPNRVTYPAMLPLLAAFTHFAFFLGINAFYYGKDRPSRRKENSEESLA